MFSNVSFISDNSQYRSSYFIRFFLGHYCPLRVNSTIQELDYQKKKNSFLFHSLIIIHTHKQILQFPLEFLMRIYNISHDPKNHLKASNFFLTIYHFLLLQKFAMKNQKTYAQNHKI